MRLNLIFCPGKNRQCSYDFTISRGGEILTYSYSGVNGEMTQSSFSPSHAARPINMLKSIGLAKYVWRNPNLPYINDIDIILIELDIGDSA